MSSIRSILDKLAFDAMFHGQNPDKNTKPSVDQALLEISELIEKEVIDKRDDGKSFMKMSGYAKRKILIEYGIRVNQLIALKELLK